MLKNNRQLKISLIIAAVFFLVNLIFVLAHEQFYDEANTWQIAKAVTPWNFWEVFNLEPHPVLWTIIIAPFAKLGLPYITQNILSLLVVTLCVFLLMWKAPFSNKVKIILVFSGAFMLYYTSIARDYCLVVLGLVLVAVTYKDRLKHPVRHLLSIIVLFQSHFLAFPLAFLMSGFFIYDLKKNKHKVLPYTISLIICVASVVMCAIGPLLGHGVIYGVDRNVGIDFVGYVDGVNVTLFGLNFPIIELAVLFSCILLLKRHPRPLVILIFSYVAQMGILLFIYKDFYSVLKNALLIHYVIFSLWLAYYYKENSPYFSKIRKVINKSEIARVILHYSTLAIPLIVIAIMTIPRLVACAKYELEEDFDVSHMAASYINEQLPENAIIMATDDNTLCITIAPLLEGNRIMWSLSDEAQIVFSKVSKKLEPTKTNSEIEAIVSRSIDSNVPVYLIAAYAREIPDEFTIIKEFEITPGPEYYNFEEHFYLAKPNFSR